jgi:hypothetical protein
MIGPNGAISAHIAMVRAHSLSVPSFGIGTFTADATTESITMSSTTPVSMVNSIEMRTSGVPTPEPSTLALALTGIVGLRTLRRRR